MKTLEQLKKENREKFGKAEPHEAIPVGQAWNLSDQITTKAYQAGVKDALEKIDEFLSYPLIHSDMRQALEAIKEALSTLLKK